MTKENKDFLIKTLVVAALFIICYLVMGFIAEFIGTVLAKAIISAIAVFGIIGIADKIGLPGFAASKGKKK